MIHSLAEGKTLQLIKKDMLNKAKAVKAKVESDKKAETAKKQAQLNQQKTESTKPSGQIMMMEATAYSCNEGVIGGGNLTATGQDLRVDPLAILL